jgi:uncharacterized membrane protein
MEKNAILLVLLISITLILSAYLINLRITGMFIGFGSPTSEFVWWNVSWHYRMKLEVNATQYDRADWPIERAINFTDLLPSGTFDENSTRIFEYYTNGSIIYEVPSQFDRDDGYNAVSNALGMLVFSLNGTTPSNTKRIFYVYYDTIENQAKQYPNYTTNLVYNCTTPSCKEFNVNTSALAFWVDTSRGENTSGLYKVIGISGGNEVWWPIPGLNDRTIEYMEYSNGTYNFSFNLSNNATLKYSGPVRIVVEQKGNEVLWNSTNLTEGFVAKRYVFYDLNPNHAGNQWIKIETNYTNLGGSSITRNSTFAGAIAIDAKRAFGTTWQSNQGDITPPGWWYASDNLANRHTGIIQVNQSGTSNFWVPDSSSKDRIGIELNSTSINSGSSILETAALHFNDTSGYYPQVSALRDRLANPIDINQSLPEGWYSAIVPSTNVSIANRNETVLIIGNLSIGDPYNLTKGMNATLDMGTSNPSDDQTIELNSSGDYKLFNGTFQVPNNGNVSLWSINFTAYGNNSEFLNSTVFTFNVTDILNVSVSVINKKPLVNALVFANIHVRNYRQDSWILGATINCSYGTSEVVNKTDYNNGTYSVNFTSPNQEGSYYLYCNATQNGNFGNNSDNFTAESAKVNISIIALPQNPSVSNITIYDNETFSLTANATNIANGTAYSSNISLELLNGWSSDGNLKQCGDIEKVNYCIKYFNITVPNGTSPGNYYINVTAAWVNPDGTSDSNKTQVNVTVNSNPKIIVEENSVSSEVGDGVWNLIGNFTASSIGNEQLLNVTFTCYSGIVCSDFNITFNPINISSLEVGSKQNVSINMSIPLNYTNGTYNGTVNISAQNDGFDTFNISVVIPSKTNLSIITSISNYTAYNVTQQINESFEFKVNVTNIGNGSARSPNISLVIPSNWSSNSSLEYCNNLTKSVVCSKGFNITIPKGTLAGNYYVNVTTNWTNNDNALGTNKTYINVTVAPNPLINVSETNVSGNVTDGTMQNIGNFTVLSIGNGPLQNITFNCYQGSVCQNFNASFNPVSISSLNVSSNQTVSVNVTVPLGFLAGTYNGTVNVSAQNDNYKNLTLFVTVPSNRTWTMSPANCQRSEYPDEGTACEVVVRNVGNDIINFTISPEYGTHTKVNVTSFYTNAASNYTFNVTYNVTNVSQGVYISTFNISATQSDSNPKNMTLNVTMLPYLPPSISFDITPNSTEQNSSVEIFANVTDASSSGINWVNISVTRPDGVTNQTNMTIVSQNGSTSQWYFKYPSNLGNTSLRGLYNVTVSAGDNIGNVANLTKNFSVYIKLLITSMTLSDRYLQGDSGSIYYVVRNMSQTGLNNVNVTFTIINPTNNVSYYSEHITNSEGTISPPPSFSLASDVLTGNYTLSSNTTYYDSVMNSTILVSKNSTFQVQSRTITVTGLFADIETAVVWYPNNTLRVGILVYNGEGRPVDPTEMNLTVYDPDSHPYFNITMSQMIRASTGYYTYQRTLSEVIPSGMYLAVLNVSQNEFQTMKLKAFRVAHGGPYDVWISTFENEVPQGDNLDFTVNIENKGEVTQDVRLDYWVSANNVTWYNNSGQEVLTPALSNQSFTRTAYINSTQPLGSYTLNVRVLYDTLQQPVINSVTFTVVSKTTPIPPNVTLPPPQTIYIYGAPSSGALTMVQPTEKISASIFISGYNSNISLTRNFTKIESVTVKNNGIVDLDNVSLFILGIPLEWFKIVPETYTTLKPENTSIFLIEFNIPKNAKPDEYKANLIATSGVVSDQKTITIKIYQSLEELISSDISKLKSDLQDLYIEIKVAEREGKDVSTVMSLYDDAKSKIDGAEVDLNNGKTEDALSKISNVPTLIKRAREMVGSLEKKKEAFDITIWIILIVFVSIIAGVFIVVILWKKKKITKIRPYIITLGRIAEAVKKKEISKADVEVEKGKLTRMLNVLEKEKEQGIITGSSYDKMKKSIEEKLSKFEKK